MQLGSLQYVLDESYLDKLLLQEYVWEGIFSNNKNKYKENEQLKKQANEAIKKVNNDFSNISNPYDTIYQDYYDKDDPNWRQTHAEEFNKRADFYFTQMDRKKNAIGTINRITKRASMYTKNQIDKLLLKLKRFAHKLELSPMKKKDANLFQKLKSAIGTAIRKLTNVLMKKFGTQHRKGKVTHADLGTSWFGISDDDTLNTGEYHPSFIRNRKNEPYTTFKD